MPIFGFFGRNLSGLEKRGSQLATPGSNSQACKIASHILIAIPRLKIATNMVVNAATVNNLKCN